VRTHGWAELIAGRPRAALAMLLRARELEEEHGSPGGLTLQSLAWCEYLLGDHQSARQHLWEAAQALSEAGERAALGWCFGILGNSFWQEGRVEQARTIAESLLAEAGSEGEPWGEGMCLVLLAVCRLEAGEPEGAEETARAALRAFAELDDAWGESMARLVQAMVQRVSGDLPAAVATLERGLRTAERVGAVGSEARLRAELAATLLDCGDERGAAREARATLDSASAGGGDRDSEIRALVVLAKRARSLGRPAEATQLLEQATGLAPGEVRTSIWRRAAALGAIVAAETGDLPRAQQLAADAVAGSWESARTWVLAQRAVAAVQRAAGNRPGAHATLTAVLDRFGDRPLAFVDAVREDLRALSAAHPDEHDEGAGAG
jgi:tetratricopeptide (TPR) repeat protein